MVELNKSVFDYEKSFSMSKMESSMSKRADGGTGEFLLRSSKTFEDYEEKEINAGKFLKELI